MLNIPPYDDSIAPLRLLLIEDNEDDAALVLLELRSGGYPNVLCHRVETADDLQAALDQQVWDVVLSDYSLPGFDGLSALRLVQATDKDIPFILISGAIGEETAVAALKAGAHDYLLKDRLYRLVPAIQREMEESLRRQQLRQVQADLATAKYQAELANQRKSQVLAFVAHEFKNPILAIKLYGNMLMQQTAPPLSDLAQSWVGNITLGAQQLQELVSDILDVSAIENNRVNLRMEYVSVQTLVDSALTIVEEGAHEKHIAIHIALNERVPLIEADPKRIRQVLINLLSNAIKYSHHDSTITISNRLSEDGHTMCMDIKDQGIGMTETETQQLFREFYRVNRRATLKQEGMGLGLALSKKLIELHQGEITVVSELGKGSTFTIHLPLKQQPAFSEAAAPVITDDIPAV